MIRIVKKMGMAGNGAFIFNFFFFWGGGAVVSSCHKLLGMKIVNISFFHPCNLIHHAYAYLVGLSRKLAFKSGTSVVKIELSCATNLI